ncbi:hypothetical protein HBO18_18755 [Pseudomonas lactis]|uniref:Uncharacterized protein n=1 Tax=Pseudomonas lactis TaxID=1615674 RepID=A0A7Y1LHE1_9PSED|nr:hypothetical protein [Pseudomonas lactis]NNA46160.1 hypothetical protein [Pseudomonas lactis]
MNQSERLSSTSPGDENSLTQRVTRSKLTFRMGAPNIYSAAHTALPKVEKSKSSMASYYSPAVVQGLVDVMEGSREIAIPKVIQVVGEY